MSISFHIWRSLILTGAMIAGTTSSFGIASSFGWGDGQPDPYVDPRVANLILTYTRGDVGNTMIECAQELKIPIEFLVSLTAKPYEVDVPSAHRLSHCVDEKLVKQVVNTDDPVLLPRVILPDREGINGLPDRVGAFTQCKLNPVSMKSDGASVSFDPLQLCLERAIKDSNKQQAWTDLIRALIFLTVLWAATIITKKIKMQKAE